MTHRVKKCSSELCYLANCCTKNRKFIIRGSNQELVKAIGDIALNIIKNKIPLTSAEKRKVKKYINALQTLGTSSVSTAKKKSVLSSQKGGAVLGLLWNVIKNII